jgi:hypothetical protein
MSKYPRTLLHMPRWKNVQLSLLNKFRHFLHEIASIAIIDRLESVLSIDCRCSLLKEACVIKPD